MADEINKDLLRKMIKEVTQYAKAESQRPVLDLQGDDTPDVEAHHVAPEGGNCISVLSVT